MKKKEEFQEEYEIMRLNKFISHNTKYSRREADTLIEEGKVKVNNKPITNLATKVKTTDKVSINHTPIKYERNKIITVVCYNKPKGEIVSKNDPQGRKTIFDSLGAKFKHFMPIGRLDYASEGLLLLTDSVDVMNKLANSDLERLYKLKVDGEITQKVEDTMKNGLELEDARAGGHEKSKITSMKFAPFLAYDIQTNGEKFSKIKVSIIEGKNRELRRFFAHFGLEVLDLKRLEYGGISLNNLPTGKSRYLTKEEYRDLRYYMNQKDND